MGVDGFDAKDLAVFVAEFLRRAPPFPCSAPRAAGEGWGKVVVVSGLILVFVWFAGRFWRCGMGYVGV